MPPTSGESSALARRFLTDVVAGDDDAAACTFMADDATVHNLVFAARPGVSSVAARIRPPFVRSELDINDDDLVARATGSPFEERWLVPHQRPERTDRPRAAIDHAWFCRLGTRRIADLWSLPDGLGLCEQLDVVPSWMGSGRRLSNREDSEK